MEVIEELLSNKAKLIPTRTYALMNDGDDLQRGTKKTSGRDLDGALSVEFLEAQPEGSNFLLVAPI